MKELIKRFSRRRDPPGVSPLETTLANEDHIQAGKDLMSQFNVQETSAKAMAILRSATVHFEALRGTPNETPEAAFELAKCYIFAGRNVDFKKAYAKYLHLKRMSPAYQALSTMFRGADLEFVPQSCVSALGCTGYISTYIKRNILLGKKGRIVICAPDGEVSNPAFLSYFEPYAEIISDPNAIRSLKPIRDFLEDARDWALEFNGPPQVIHSITSQIHKQWAAEGRPPLLSLGESHLKRGREVVAQIGLKPDDWWVCAHVRSSSFYKEGEKSKEDFRNADIKSYFKAFKVITDQGGYVFRMGDPSMEPLPRMEKVIDYANSQWRSDWMDVFLCAKSRFFIGTSSGLHVVPSEFGVPGIHTNALPLAYMPFPANDIVLPKLLRKKDNTVMSLKEYVQEPYHSAMVQYLFDELELEIVNNTEDEIATAVTNMLNTFVEDAQKVPELTDLQKRFNALFDGLEYSVSGNVDPNFIEKHRDLLI